MRIILQPFGGEIPRRSPELLPDHNATVARNCKLYSGEIRPWGGLRGVADGYEAGDLGTLHRFMGEADSEISGVITGATQADPVVITCVDHDLSNDDKIYIEGINGGSHNLNYSDYLVTVLTSDTFSLQDLSGTDIDGTGYDAFGSNGYFTHQHGYWFTTADGVRADFVRGPINNDTTERTYYTLSNAAPRMTYSTIAETGDLDDTYPQDSWPLGVPAPTAAPTLDFQTNQRQASPTAISQSDPCVVTFGASDIPYVDSGDEVIFQNLIDSFDMTQLDYNNNGGTSYTVEQISETEYNLMNAAGTDYIDSTGYTAHTAKSTDQMLHIHGNWGSGDAAPFDEREVRAYVYTYLTSIGEEGPPSDPLEINAWSSAQTHLDFTAPPAGYDIDRINLYRLSNGEYQYNDTINTSSLGVGFSFTDKLKDADLGELLPSTLWDPPPSDLTSLISLPNGVMAGVSTNRVCLSEPNVPHAWPATYQQVGNYDFVGCSNFDTTIVAATVEDAYLINGATPDASTMEALEIRQGCVSEKSFVSLGNYGVMYASPDGLVAVTRDGVRVATEPFFKRQEWRALKPETIDGYLYEDYYVGFFDDGTKRAFLFDPRNPDEGFVFVDFYATAAYYDHLDDALYAWAIDESDPGFIPRIAKFDDVLHATDLTYRWRSKTYDTPELVSFTCGEVHAASYDDLTLRLYADDVLVHTQTVTSNEPFRVSSYSPARSHQVEVEGVDNVKRIVVAEAFEEIP